MTTFDFAYQEKGSKNITFVMMDESEVQVLESAVLDFIDENQLNMVTEYFGNNSPRGDGDPDYDIEHDVVTDASEYLSAGNNFDDVCELYFKTVLINNLLQNVA